MNKDKIYLDYAATTPVDKEVLSVMRPYFSDKFGNPMTIHNFGHISKDAIDKSRKQISEFLGCMPGEVFFTSGATESNNMAIRGVVGNSRKVHIITTAIEHKSTLETLQILERDGVVDVTYLPVGKNGIVKVKDVKSAIRKNTVLVSVMYVNNEIGTVQPISSIGKLLKNSKIIFHTDATQAVNYFNCDVDKLNVDIMSISGHKIYGPKGIGAIYIKLGTKIKPILTGGGQESGVRAGTHNVPGIVGLSKAIELVGDKSSVERKSMLKLRDYLIKRVLKEIPNSYLNGSQLKRSPNNANFRFDNVEGESIVMSLNLDGIAAGTGSACSSGALAPSHVLLALGLKHEQAHGSLRVSMGRNTTKKDIDTIIKKLKIIIKRLRKISGNVLDEFK